MGEAHTVIEANEIVDKIAKEAALRPCQIRKCVPIYIFFWNQVLLFRNGLVRIRQTRMGLILKASYLNDDKNLVTLEKWTLLCVYFFKGGEDILHDRHSGLSHILWNYILSKSIWNRSLQFHKMRVSSSVYKYFIEWRYNFSKSYCDNLTYQTRIFYIGVVDMCNGSREQLNDNN